jgi:hypothetical protein
MMPVAGRESGVDPATALGLPESFFLLSLRGLGTRWAPPPTRKFADALETSILAELNATGGTGRPRIAAAPRAEMAVSLSLVQKDILQVAPVSGNISASRRDYLLAKRDVRRALAVQFRGELVKEGPLADRFGAIALLLDQACSWSSVIPFHELRRAISRTWDTRVTSPPASLSRHVMDVQAAARHFSPVGARPA